jgi:ribosomal protein S18 acetylase RimI-like enzyme
MRIRAFVDSDREPVIGLWRRAGLVRPWNDPGRDIDRKMADSPWGLLVGESDESGDERLIASMMVGYDGHRGSVFYLAVDPDARGRGHGSRLMAHAEALLLARGCPKVNVSVRSENSQVIGFYADRGYRTEGGDHAVTMALRLIPDGPQP